MLKKLLIILILFITVSASFCFVKIVSAETAKDTIKNQLQYAGTPSWGTLPTAESSMAGIVALVIKAFLGLLGIIFLILIIYAGYSWMTAQGEEEKVTKAKDTLQRAIIGLIIIIAAYSITYFVFNALPGGGSGSGLPPNNTR